MRIDISYICVHFSNRPSDGFKSPSDGLLFFICTIANKLNAFIKISDTYICFKMFEAILYRLDIEIANVKVLA